MKKNLNLLVKEKLDMNQKPTFVAQKIKCPFLGSIKSLMGSRLRDMILPLYSVLMRSHLECRIQFWGLQYKKDMQGVWRWAMKMIRGL